MVGSIVDQPSKNLLPLLFTACLGPMMSVAVEEFHTWPNYL